jgi:AmpE protein
MSLISLLIALTAERYLSSPAWQFKTFYQRYFQLFKGIKVFSSPWQSNIATASFILTPVLISHYLLALVDDSLLYFIFSTLILIVCFGCVSTRSIYKKYLLAAFRGDMASADLYYKKLQRQKNLPDMSFGQILVWLNYRYFIAIMIFFVIFGAAGALFYRLLVTVVEASNQDISNDVEQSIDQEETAEDLPNNTFDESLNVNTEESDDAETQIEVNADQTDEQVQTPVNDNSKGIFSLCTQCLFWIDWLPVRFVAVGYMLVGHFSRALPVWLDNIFDVKMLPSYFLIKVAQKSEDFMVDNDDCTAEPCLLVRLAKRTLLLCLTVIAVLILTGVLS